MLGLRLTAVLDVAALVDGCLGAATPDGIEGADLARLQALVLAQPGHLAWATGLSRELRPGGIFDGEQIALVDPGAGRVPR